MGKSIKHERIINFIEELSWLLSNYESHNLGFEVSKFIKEIKQSQDKMANIGEIGELKPDNPNILFLVGILPSLFMNRKIFPKNEDITNFAEKVLKVKISRPGKRSQYEIIGLIMCEVTTLDDNSLVKVVNELKQFTSKKGKSNKEVNWNDVIRKLSGEFLND